MKRLFLVLLALLCAFGGFAFAQGVPAIQNTTSSFLYDANGNQTSATDPLLHVTTYGYDGLNRLTRVTDPTNNSVRYAYDGLDQLVRVADPRFLVTTYQYDGLGNQIQLQSPDTGATNKTYDDSGNLASQTDAKGQTTSYQYDVLNRIVGIVFADGNLISYGWDQGTNGLGRLTQIVDATGTIQYAYDGNGRLLGEQRTLDAATTTGSTASTSSTSYTYDAAGRLASVTYPSGRVLAYGRDAAGRISQVSSSKDGATQVLAGQIRYQPFRGVASYVNGANQTINRSFDLDGRMTAYTLDRQQRTLSYDAASRITAQGDGTAANTVNYDYDPLDRLTSALKPNGGLAYAYDAVGNRTSLGNGAALTSYGYAGASNRLLQSSGAQVKTYVTDANGSIVNNGTSQFIYDARGRMIAANTALGAVQYRINALGQRVQKLTPNGGTVFHYDSGGRLIAESDGRSWKEYVYLGDMPIAVLTQ